MITRRCCVSSRRGRRIPGKSQRSMVNESMVSESTVVENVERVTIDQTFQTVVSNRLLM